MTKYECNLSVQAKKISLFTVPKEQSFQENLPYSACTAINLAACHFFITSILINLTQISPTLLRLVIRHIHTECQTGFQ